MNILEYASHFAYVTLCVKTTHRHTCVITWSLSTCTLVTWINIVKHVTPIYAPPSNAWDGLFLKPCQHSIWSNIDLYQADRENGVSL